jgi:hypothetical protein
MRPTLWHALFSLLALAKPAVALPVNEWTHIQFSGVVDFVFTGGPQAILQQTFTGSVVFDPGFINPQNLIGPSTYNMRDPVTEIEQLDLTINLPIAGEMGIVGEGTFTNDKTLSCPFFFPGNGAFSACGELGSFGLSATASSLGTGAMSIAIPGFGSVYTGTITSVTEVPEPGTLSLMTLGFASLLALVALRRHRNANSQPHDLAISSRFSDR